AVHMSLRELYGCLVPRSRELFETSPPDPLSLTGSGLVSVSLHMLDLQHPRGRSQVLETAAEHRSPRRLARILVGVASDLREPKHGFGDGRLGFGHSHAELDHLQRAHLERAELDAGGCLWVDTSDALEAFDPYGHRREDRRPALHGNGRPQ